MKLNTYIGNIVLNKNEYNIIQEIYNNVNIKIYKIHSS